MVALAKRFVEIEGGVLAALLAVEFFTTMLPLVIIGYGYMSGFAHDASVGTVIGRELGLDRSSTDFLRSAFGSSARLRSTWTLLGVAGFLVWGIPMSMTIASMFARAWRRQPLSTGTRLWRGMLWFFLYLAVLVAREHLGGHVPSWERLALFTVSMIPLWAFWSLTPVILVRDGGHGRRFLVLAGLVGVAIDGVITGVGVRIVFPILLEGWKQFGPIGVSMTLMTWSGVIGIAWVITACAGAIVWERSAPAATVIQAQSGDPNDPVERFQRD